MEERNQWKNFQNTWLKSCTIARTLFRTRYWKEPFPFSVHLSKNVLSLEYKITSATSWCWSIFQIIFSPCNKNSRLLPLDAGIIFSIKNRYRTRNFERYFGIGWRGNWKKIYDVNIISSMRWLVDIWENIPSSIIKYYFGRTGVLGDQRKISTMIIEFQVLLLLKGQNFRSASTLFKILPFKSLLKKLLNAADELNCTKPKFQWCTKWV